MSVGDMIRLSEAAAQASCAGDELKAATAYWIANASDMRDVSRARAERHLAKCADLMGFDLVKRETAEDAHQRMLKLRLHEGDYRPLAVATCDRAPDEETMWGRD